MSAIGDALFELVDGDYDGNGMPDYVLAWPVIKTTDRFVYVDSPRSWQSEQTFRLDRAVLERDGEAWHRGERVFLHVRPGIDWPLVVMDVNDGTRAIAP